MKVARIVTASEAVEFHLRNTLDQFNGEYELEVIGDGVSKYSERWPLVRFTDVLIVRKINLYRDLLALIALTRLFRKRGYDITHSIMPKAGLLNAIAGLLAGIPVRIHTFTGQIWTNFSGPKRFFFKTIDRIVVLLCTKCLTDSASQSQFLFEQGIGARQSPLPFLGSGSLSGVNAERFNSERLHDARVRIRGEIGADEKTIVFIFLGRKCKDKGTLDLLRAFRNISDKYSHALLLLVGPEDDDDFQQLYYSKFASLPQIINYAATRTPEDYLAAGDIFCIPSYREGFGSVVIEAAALGMASIGTNITGLKDAIVDHQTGVLVEPGNIERLTQCMEQAVLNPVRYGEMGKNAKARALKNFTMKRLFELLNEEYQLLSRRFTQQ